MFLGWLGRQQHGDSADLDGLSSVVAALDVEDDSGVHVVVADEVLDEVGVADGLIDDSLDDVLEDRALEDLAAAEPDGQLS